MSWLINSNFAAAWQREVSQDSPTLILNFVAGNIVLFHRRDKLFDVLTDKIEFVEIVFLRGMDSYLGRWQTEDQPAMADIDVWEF